MMRTRSVLAVVTCLVLCIGLYPPTAVQWARSQEAGGRGKTPPSSEKDPLGELKPFAPAFEAAFNRGDAPAIAAQFTENAEILDEDGNLVRGRAEIEARFAELFKAYPQAKIEVEVASLRQLGPDLAVEDGVSATQLAPDELAARTPYTVLYARRGGKWLAVSVRDFPEEPPTSAHGHLQALSWLVGQWVDESQAGRVETSCDWSPDGNYLLQDYVLNTRFGVMKGSQRIGWDGVRGTIRSWAFDQSGAFTEAVWTPVDGAWVLKIEGATANGERVFGTRVLTPHSTEAFQIDSTGVLVGDTLLPETSVRVVRRPPAPVK